MTGDWPQCPQERPSFPVILPMSHPPEPATTDQVAAPTTAGTASQRLLSLDAFRGLIMLMMASAAFGIPGMAKAFPESWWWQQIGYHCDHAAWVGCSLWDLIQPSFMFMVGVALAFSAAKRQAGGQSFGWMFAHALWRGFMLVMLAVFLTSSGSSIKQTVWEFTNVLAQIGLGYPILFLLAFTSTRTQVIAAAVILIGDWAAFALWPTPPADLNWAGVNVAPNWPHLTGFEAHWEKNTNIATAFDQWFLNLFPTETRYTFGRGYQTLNFVPSLATMIFGLITGKFLRGDQSIGAKVGRLVLAGLLFLSAGQLLAISGVCPMVKHLWTPTFAIFSTGWVLLFLAFFVAVIEWAGWKKWAVPLLVAGLNPITLYTLWQTMGGFISENIRRHFGQNIFKSAGYFGLENLSDERREALSRATEEGLRRAAILLVLWLILWWMYRRKIVVRI